MTTGMTPAKQAALAWIDSARTALSEDHQVIWRFAEPAWREYHSAAWYVERLRAEGFEVEVEVQPHYGIHLLARRDRRRPHNSPLFGPRREPLHADRLGRRHNLRLRS